jgi:hypothetical protein
MAQRHGRSLRAAARVVDWGMQANLVFGQRAWWSNRQRRAGAGSTEGVRAAGACAVGDVGNAQRHCDSGRLWLVSECAGGAGLW